MNNRREERNMTALLSLAVAVIAGLMMSRVVKRFSLPAVTAYLVAGVLIARLPDRLWRMPLAFACGLAVCYAFGTVMFSIVTDFEP